MCLWKPKIRNKHSGISHFIINLAKTAYRVVHVPVAVYIRVQYDVVLNALSAVRPFVGLKGPITLSLEIFL